MIEFFKLEALGNDFVLVDARAHADDPTADRACRLADRRRGVGCDQVLALRPPSRGGAFAVRIRNADGSSAEQCGNGMRALAAWLQTRGELARSVVVETEAGDVELDCVTPGQYRAELPGPRALSAGELGRPPLPPIDGVVCTELVSMGNPHLVVFTEHVPDGARLAHLVDEIESKAEWRDADNIELGCLEAPGRLALQVHERGAGPTPACGSGACAAAWTAAHRLGGNNPMVVEQPGGSLVVDWRRPSGRILTTGPASVVFQGRIA
jgi:diaminopimelate epimerase